jgi:hypothetical protein|tara:strand:- start:5413 stop:6045 length:633 start_codon:yes stop_codon:yes gene_type:complete
MSENTAITLAPSGLTAAFGDIDIPRLNIIQKMSEIEGTLGSVVLDKEAEIALAGAKLDVVVVGAIKRWKEDIPFDDDQIPQFADTEEASRELAAKSDFGVLEFAEIVMLIPQPGSDDTHFPYPIGKKNYQIGRLTVQKDAYRLTYKRLFTFSTFNKAVPVSSRLWSFSSDLMTKGKYSWFVPSLTITKGVTPKEVLEFVNNNLMGGSDDV